MSKFDFSGASDVRMRAFSPRAVLKSIIISYAFTFIVFAVFAAVITYTGFSEKYIDTVVMITTVLSIIIAGVAVSTGARSRGWLNGGIGGLVYMLILMLLGIIFSDGAIFEMSDVLVLMLGFVLGAFGGIIGINMKRK